MDLANMLSGSMGDPSEHFLIKRVSKFNMPYNTLAKKSRWPHSLSAIVHLVRNDHVAGMNIFFHYSDSAYCKNMTYP